MLSLRDRIKVLTVGIFLNLFIDWFRYRVFQMLMFSNINLLWFSSRWHWNFFNDLLWFIFLNRLSDWVCKSMGIKFTFSNAFFDAFLDRFKTLFQLGLLFWLTSFWWKLMTFFFKIIWVAIRFILKWFSFERAWLWNIFWNWS